MRILVLANKLPYPPRDGGSIATLNMLTGLAGTGHQMTCLALNTRKHRFPVEEIPETLTSKVRFIGIDCNSDLRPLALMANLIASRKPYIAVRFRNKRFARRLASLLEEETFDLVQLEGPYPGHYIPLVRESGNIPVSFRAHNVEHLIWRRKASRERFPPVRWYLRNLAARLERYELDVLRQSDLLVAISPLDEACFRQMGWEKPSVSIPAGFSLDQYPVTPVPEEPVVGFIGALDWLPNQEGLTWFIRHVLPRLNRSLPAARFLVAGRNAPDPFRKYLEQQPLEFRGEVADAHRFMQECRVLVAPLFTGSGIRIKILEAMAMGRPVVTTPVGMEGIPAGEDQGALVSDKPDLFHDHIVTLLQKGSTATTLAAAGRSFVQENFDTFELSTRLGRFFHDQA